MASSVSVRYYASRASPPYWIDVDFAFVENNAFESNIAAINIGICKGTYLSQNINALRMEKTRVDSEFLIATIKNYESIWNKDSKAYHKKSAKEDAWNQVCEELIDNWNTFSEAVKNSKQYELKKRWNNIRDYYKKDLALQLNGSIGQPSMKRKKYVFSKQLDFLRPFFDKSYNNEKASEDDIEEEEVYLEENYSSESEKSYSLKRKNTVKITEDQNILEEAANKNTEVEYIEDDSDLLFLKSLLPDMKMLSRAQKIDFKLGILHLYKNIINENNECEVYEISEDSKNPLK